MQHVSKSWLIYKHKHYSVIIESVNDEMWQSYPTRPLTHMNYPPPPMTTTRKWTLIITWDHQPYSHRRPPRPTTTNDVSTPNIRQSPANAFRGKHGLCMQINTLISVVTQRHNASQSTNDSPSSTTNIACVKHSTNVPQHVNGMWTIFISIFIFLATANVSNTRTVTTTNNAKRGTRKTKSDTATNGRANVYTFLLFYSDAADVAN